MKCDVQEHFVLFECAILAGEITAGNISRPETLNKYVDFCLWLNVDVDVKMEYAEVDGRR